MAGPHDPSPARLEMLRHLANLILGVQLDHPVRVAIDGVDGAGKTTLGDELVLPISRQGREVIRASIDGFHRPRADRLRRGRDSAEGYYLDSFDHDAIWSSLLKPLGPGGSREYRRAVFDFRTDTARPDEVKIASQDAVLLVDGVFLLRPELAAGWDLSVFVKVGFEETLRRVTIRDQALFGPPEAVIDRYRRRYVPGQELYLAAAEPESRADVVLVNEDPENPILRTNHPRS